MPKKYWLRLLKMNLVFFIRIANGHNHGLTIYIFCFALHANLCSVTCEWRKMFFCEPKFPNEMSRRTRDYWQLKTTTTTAVLVNTNAGRIEKLPQKRCIKEIYRNRLLAFVPSRIRSFARRTHEEHIARAHWSYAYSQRAHCMYASSQRSTGNHHTYSKETEKN